VAPFVSVDVNDCRAKPTTVVLLLALDLYDVLTLDERIL
jgi:hypothetical protein